MHNTTNTRRNFLLKLAVTAPVALGGRLLAQDAPPPPPPVKLEETDPVAIALGYKMDTAKVDQTKYPQHKPEQKCADCALVAPGSKPGEFIPCTAFQNKLVASGGWCMAFVKKPDPAAPPVAPPAAPPVAPPKP